MIALGHLCYRLTDVPPQPNSQLEDVTRVAHQASPASIQNQTPARTTGHYVTE